MKNYFIIKKNWVDFFTNYDEFVKRCDEYASSTAGSVEEKFTIWTFNFGWVFTELDENEKISKFPYLQKEEMVIYFYEVYQNEEGQWVDNDGYNYNSEEEAHNANSIREFIFI